MDLDNEYFEWVYLTSILKALQFKINQKRRRPLTSRSYLMNDVKKLRNLIRAKMWQKSKDMRVQVELCT